MRIVKKKKGKKRRRKKSKENCQHPIAIHRRRAEKSNAENEETNDECVCVCVWIAVFAWSVKLHEREDEQVYCPARRVHRRPRRAGSLRS